MYQQTISIQLAPMLRIAILLTILLTNAFVWTAPSNKPSVSEFESKQEFEDALNNFLNIYYDEIVSKHNHDIDDLLKQTFQRNDVTESYHSNKAKRRSLDDDSVEDYQTNNGKKSFSNAYDTDIYDQMQGDQPVTEDTDSTKVTADPMTITRERLQRDLDESFLVDFRLRKENWVEYLKTHILNHIGRSNSTFTKPPEDPPLTDFNVTDILPKILNTTMFDDDQITEKIRSFYPSCEIPQNQQDQQDSWKDEDVMNLYFNFDYHSDNKNINIATATLRLYRLPQNGTNFTAKKDDCDNLDSVEEDKLLRVSVYWYTKYQKKRRVKKRLSDSKVIFENAHWVELSVKPATKAWNKAGARNLGLGIQVEDQEGKTLKADRYFKGASCTVGVSTPKPIPTIVRDASHLQTNERVRIHSLPTRNSTPAIYSDVQLLPTVDICYLEFPDNVDLSGYSSSRINACNLRKIYEENQRLVERERVERLATLPNSRHIRHRQHRQTMKTANKNLGNDNGMSELESSIRSSLTNKQIVFTREEIENFQRNRGLNR
ncbi:uncharacterized protein LOC143192771 isoform X2 [Rhynchophorus ferrugineus]|uniref:uncharacterized protein LOC143192771 isoform X2 n=1 Tax=Rhynchophorus ferrugineus TaxID=354439 RepID=UPI003FCEB9AB